ncbi:MAG: HlyC/CorC family transporter [Candidatus Hydrogenedens sp.]|nr:HlyC/CorC family transporter [Candidatus Hydrogenedentota bacterium]NLF56609.1 HlyC/CorC family transporter [Candidatus Hydrogenedens sp.]
MAATLMDETAGEPPRSRKARGVAALAAALAVVCLLLAAGRTGAETPMTEAPHVPWTQIFTPNLMAATVLLSVLSGFFSASEVAYFSLQKVTLRGMRENGGPFARLAARLMEQPGNLLATLLMGNSIVNVLLGVVFGEPMAEVFEFSLGFSTPQAYALSIAVTASLLVFFCEVAPKVMVVRHNALFAQAAAAPIYAADRLLRPLRDVVTAMVGHLFRITRFSEVPPAPFITDEEFKSLLEDSRVSGVIEEDERQMIEGIIEFGDKTVRDILVPRPDIVSISVQATAGEALKMFREHEYSRMPVCREDLDHITGILYAKDLLPVVEDGALDTPIAELARRVHYVPETMPLADFLKAAQKTHSHIAVVVDEYGGTEGLVTLQDAIREVVGDIGEEDDGEEGYCERMGEGVYCVDGTYSLLELEKLAGITVDDEEHTTVAGFIMAQVEKIPQVGDEMEYSGVRFRIEETCEKRVTRVRIEFDGGLDKGGDAA